MKYNLGKLSNGIKVICVPMPSLESATVTVWVKTGSRFEEERINGISHFLEHMIFKGSKKRPSAKKIAEAVDEIGGEFNAGTSKDWTNFYIKARSSNINKALDVLSDMVLNPLLSQEEIGKEKGVIIEELRMHEDTPMMKIGDVFEQLIFAGNPLGRDIAGSEKTVRGVSRSDFLRYRSIHYYPQKMLLTIAGGIKEGDALKLAEKYFENLNRKNLKKTSEILFKSKQKKPQVKLHPKKKEQAHFILGFLADGREYEGRFAQTLLSAILGGGMSSRLFSEVRERRGLAYAISTSTERYLETGYIGTYAGVDVERAHEAIKVTLEEHYKLANNESGVDKKELRKAKEYIKGHLALALEDTKDVNDFYGVQALFLKEILTPEEVFKRIDAVSVEDVLEEAKKLFRPERLNLAIIGPYKDQARFERLLM